MKEPQAPCIDCGHRKEKCHGSCKEYLEYEHARKAYREHISKQKIEENVLTEIEIQRFRK